MAPGQLFKRITKFVRPHFGLRTLLILVALFATGFGYLGHLYRRVAHQRYIVAKIDEAGGTVHYKNSFYDSSSVARSIRKLIGDDAIEDVVSVNFIRYLDPPSKLDPQLLLELPKLEKITLVGPQVNDDWLQCIAKVPSLNGLWLESDAFSSATKDGLAHLSSATKLDTLYLYGDWVRDDTLEGLRNLPRLDFLGIYDAPNVTSAAFAQIGSLAELRGLIITRAKNIDGPGTEHLRALHNLKYLRLCEIRVSDATLENLAELRSLQQLELLGTEISDRGMSYLARLLNVKILQLNQSRVSDVGLDAISDLPYLRHLSLAGTNISDSSLPAIARIKQLQGLHLLNTAVTDDGLSQLRSLTNLKSLDIGPNVTKQAAEELQKSLPQCGIRGQDKNGRFDLEPEGHK